MLPVFGLCCDLSRVKIELDGVLLYYDPWDLFPLSIDDALAT